MIASNYVQFGTSLANILEQWDHGRIVLQHDHERRPIQGSIGNKKPIGANMTHLNRNPRRGIKKIPLEKVLITLSLYWCIQDFQLSGIPVNHYFEFKKYEPINYKRRHMALKHSFIQNDEIENILCHLLNITKFDFIKYEIPLLFYVAGKDCVKLDEHKIETL